MAVSLLLDAKSSEDLADCCYHVATPFGAVDTLWVYIVYVLSTCLNQRSLFIPYNAETLPQNCSWSSKEHHQLEGQPSEQLYWATGQDFKKKGIKKGNKHTRLFDSIYQKWSFPVGLQISLTSEL